MPIYLISCDMRDMSHDYEHLFHALREMGGHQAHPTTWFLESDTSLPDLSASLLGLMARTDGLLVLEITPGTPWAATRLGNQAGEWLKLRRP